MLQCLKKQTRGGHQRKKISILQIVFLLMNITLVTSTSNTLKKIKAEREACQRSLKLNEAVN